MPGMRGVVDRGTAVPARPTLLNSCAWAATAAEARYRIANPHRVARSTRVVALDRGAAVIVRSLDADRWPAARVLSYDPDAAGPARDDPRDDLLLHTASGAPVRLGDELRDADFALMVATADDGAPAASVIGDACALRGIMTAGVVVGDQAATGAAVSALRPYARVLLVSRDRQDVAEILSTVGA